MPHVTSIQIGEVRTAGDPASSDVDQRLWTSAFDKQPVPGPVTVHSLGIQGDAVADTEHHGGPDKAILCYAANHYLSWSQELPQLQLGPGAFAENLTLADADESSVCIGDRYATDHCVFEVSQPRQPCWKISRRWGASTLTKAVAQSGRTGWYVRVLQGGRLTSGEAMVCIERPHPEWTIARANDLLCGRTSDDQAVAKLAELPRLASAWKASLQRPSC